MLLRSILCSCDGVSAPIVVDVLLLEVVSSCTNNWLQCAKLFADVALRSSRGRRLSFASVVLFSFIIVPVVVARACQIP